MANILRGKPVADGIYLRLLPRIEELAKRNVIPCLAVVSVGENKSAQAYAASAEKQFKKYGMVLRQVNLGKNCSQDELLGLIDKINRDSSAHGCMIMRPLPRGMNEAKIFESLRMDKDVDCICSGSLTSIFCGSEEGYAPCTAQSCIELLDYYNIPISGSRIAVIGRSLVVGKPLSMMLLKRDATVTMCHSRTPDMAEICRRQDIIITAAGKRNLVDASFLSGRQVIVDVGINPGEDGKIHGDADFDSAEPMCSAISPVPGGLGSVTTAVLAEHVVKAAERCS